MYRLLAIDIDGTLVNSRDELTPGTRAALARAGEAGIRVVLATGRRYSHALPLVAAVGNRRAAGYGERGVGEGSDRPSHAVSSRVRAAGAARGVGDCRSAAASIRCSVRDTFAEGFDFYHARRETRTPELAYYLAMNPDRSRLWPELLTSPPPGVFGGFVVGTLAQMQELEAVLAPGDAGQAAHARASSAALRGSSSRLRRRA